jgi:hypothetical protein
MKSTNKTPSHVTVSTTQSVLMTYAKAVPLHATEVLVGGE